MYLKKQKDDLAKLTAAVTEKKERRRRQLQIFLYVALAQ